MCPAQAGTTVPPAATHASQEDGCRDARVYPHLGTAALVAAGIDGIERGLILAEPLAGNAYERDLPTLPHTMTAALALWSSSEFARSVFGDEVVDHYANMARIELEAFEAAVTDWELRRNFERF